MFSFIRCNMLLKHILWKWKSGPSRKKTVPGEPSLQSFKSLLLTINQTLFITWTLKKASSFPFLAYLSAIVCVLNDYNMDTLHSHLYLSSIIGELKIIFFFSILYIFLRNESFKSYYITWNFGNKALTKYFCLLKNGFQLARTISFTLFFQY